MRLEGIRKTAVIGAGGFIGSAFLSAYRRLYPDCVGTAKDPEGTDLLGYDLLRPDILPLRLEETGHREALILAATTGISRCEEDWEPTWKVNVRGTLDLVRQLSERGIKAIFTSSDYVFDGFTGGYTDDAPVNPATAYGKQKAEVEARIGEISGGNYLVVRLSKVFSLEKGDGTLLDEMAGVLVSGGRVKAAYDQIFCPTLLRDLIEAVTHLQARGATGIVNVCSPESWARYDIATALAKALGTDPDAVLRIRLHDICPGRPLNTSMKTLRLVRETGVRFTPVSECIEHVARNWRKAA